MAEQLQVSREIGAPADRVWAMVADVTRMGEWSPEAESAVWLDGATGPAPGARFRGTNRYGSKRWDTTSEVVDAEPGRAFAFRVSAKGFKVSEWRYEFEPTDAGCRVTETWTDRRGLIATWGGKSVSGVGDRLAHNRAGMETTLDRLKAAAEGPADTP
jgi:uncharacterized protein YndB with AHSA1/START domain